MKIIRSKDGASPNSKCDSQQSYDMLGKYSIAKSRLSKTSLFIFEEALLSTLFSFQDQRLLSLLQLNHFT